MGSSLMNKCLRCGGVMYFDKFYGQGEEFWGLKCTICGEIIDPVIMANRELMRTGQVIQIPREIKYERKAYA